MTEPRDESFEHLLRQSVRRSSGGGATPSCLDAETIAAWVDGGLSDEEAAAAEAHAAVCEHCRAHAVALVRNAEAPATFASTAPDLPRSASRWSWVAPLAVAALVVLAIWIPRRTSSPELDSQVAVALPPSPAPQPPSPEPASQPAARTQPVPEPGDVPRGQAQPGRRAEPAGAVPERSSATATLEQQVQVSAAPSPPPPVPSIPAVPSPPEPVREPAIGAARLPPASVAPDTVIAQFESPSNPPLAQAFTGGTGAGGVQAGRGAVAGGGGRGGRGAAAAGAGGGRGPGAPPAGEPATFRSASSVDPSQPTGWRVLANGAVERSNPPGVLWERVAIQPGLQITNGAAPAPFVCWLVGRGGVVLLTLDAQIFTRLPFPEPVDLVSVRATSARMAAVRTSDSRTFTTMDGGQTWVRE